MSPDSQAVLGTILGFLFSAVVVCIVLIGRIRERLARIEQWIEDRKRRTK